AVPRRGLGGGGREGGGGGARGGGRAGKPVSHGRRCVVGPDLAGRETRGFLPSPIPVRRLRRGENRRHGRVRVAIDHAPLRELRRARVERRHGRGVVHR